MGRYIGSNYDAIYALEKMQSIAALMRHELEKGNRIDQYIDELAARLLIPSTEFNEKVAEEIYSVYNKSNEGKANIIDFATLRKLFVENLKRKYIENILMKI